MSDNHHEVADIGLHALVKRVQDLPQEVAPERSLWPDIEAQISKLSQEKPRRAKLPLAIAASLLMAASAVGLSVYTFVAHSPADQVAVAMPATDPLTSIEAGYSPARVAYLGDMATRESNLDPRTRELLLANLSLIEATGHQIRASLQRYPNDPLLLDALELVSSNEVEILEQLAAPRANMI